MNSHVAAELLEQRKQHRLRCGASAADLLASLDMAFSVKDRVGEDLEACAIEAYPRSLILLRRVDGVVAALIIVHEVVDLVVDVEAALAPEFEVVGFWGGGAVWRSLCL